MLKTGESVIVINGAGDIELYINVEGVSDDKVPIIILNNPLFAWV